MRTSLLELVPYRRRHVPRYHRWMQSEELQLLTASEPLTLQQEYQMQKSWREDPDKCTFIVLDRARRDRGETEEEAMIGDVNLFLLDAGVDDSAACGDGSEKAAELEVMIAEPSARGAGRGRQAAAAMLRYGVEMLDIVRFQAKIGYANSASLRMFEKLGFRETSRSDVFEEVTLQVSVDKHWLGIVSGLCSEYCAEEVDCSEDEEACGAETSARIK